MKTASCLPHWESTFCIFQVYFWEYVQVSWSAIQACPRKYAFTCQNHVLLGFKWNIIKLLASEARKAVGLSRSLAIRQLSVCVYKCIWRHYMKWKYEIHTRTQKVVTVPRAGQQYRPTCGTTISSNVRDNNIVQRARQRADDFRSGGIFSRLSNDRFHWSTMT